MPKLGSGGAEKARKKLKGRKEQIDAAVDGMARPSKAQPVKKKKKKKSNLTIDPDSIRAKVRKQMGYK